MYVKRDMQAELLEVSKEYPVITLLGPRQAGKTTLVKHCFADYAYCNLENLDQRLLAQEDPRSFLKTLGQPCIIDEVQRVPQLLSYIQTMVDEVSTQKAQFILTGSHQTQLHEAIGQSLAGRTAILKLLPLSLSELQAFDNSMDANEYMFKGGLPKIYSQNLNPLRTFRNYYLSYVERDIRQLIQVKDLYQFERFLQLLASRVGQVINFNSMANDIDVSSQTLKQWTSVLQASYLIVTLKPYHKNFGKRVIKSPKIYFSDSGLLCYLLGIENQQQLQSHPLAGQIFENLVVLEAIKARYNKGRESALYFYRSIGGLEVDLLFQKGHKLIPIEIKSSRTYQKRFDKNIKRLQELNENIADGYMIYQGPLEQKIQRNSLLNYKNTIKIIS